MNLGLDRGHRPFRQKDCQILERIRPVGVPFNPNKED